MSEFKAKKIGAIKRNHIEKTDPKPMNSPVAFKRPLSAHERVLRALRQHDALKRLEAQPGDDSFDTPIDNIDTPHQLMTDPVSGQEMTAGEYVMLQHERGVAARDIQKEIQRRKAAGPGVKLKKKKLPGKAGKAAKDGGGAGAAAQSPDEESGDEN